MYKLQCGCRQRETVQKVEAVSSADQIRTEVGTAINRSKP